MITKILLALDGSPNAEKALPWVRQFAGLEKAQVVLFRAMSPHSAREVWPRERSEARDYLMGIERELNYHGIPTKVLLRRGNAAAEIVDAAADQGCDLIVMTTRGGSPVKRWVMGGVTEQVMRLSHVPVLPVWSALTRPKQGHVRRLIVPLDGSKHADSVVWWSIALAQFLRSKLVFLHVRQAGAVGRSARSLALERRTVRICQSLRKQGVPAEFALQTGDAADRILAFADRNDLILTTTHGFGGVKRWVLGSVAEKLVHAGTAPVLVYKTSA
ncbi:MAG: universal stress protein [Planctomycetaceae bacterium]|nr:universal stress protein [Planctomycetaceae bacterium]